MLLASIFSRHYDKHFAVPHKDKYFHINSEDYYIILLVPQFKRYLGTNRFRSPFTSLLSFLLCLFFLNNLFLVLRLTNLAISGFSLFSPNFRWRHLETKVALHTTLAVSAALTTLHRNFKLDSPSTMIYTFSLRPCFSLNSFFRSKLR